MLKPRPEIKGLDRWAKPETMAFKNHSCFNSVFFCEQTEWKNQCLAVWHFRQSFLCDWIEVEPTQYRRFLKRPASNAWQSTCHFMRSWAKFYICIPFFGFWLCPHHLSNAQDAWNGQFPYPNWLDTMGRWIMVPVSMDQLVKCSRLLFHHVGSDASCRKGLGCRRFRGSWFGDWWWQRSQDFFKIGKLLKLKGWLRGAVGWGVGWSLELGRSGRRQEPRELSWPQKKTELKHEWFLKAIVSGFAHLSSPLISGRGFNIMGRGSLISGRTFSN